MPSEAGSSAHAARPFEAKRARLPASDGILFEPAANGHVLCAPCTRSELARARSKLHNRRRTGAREKARELAPPVCWHPGLT